jgi:hypothetical protein
MSKSLGALIGKTATKTLDARFLVGTFSIQLLLTDTWKALRNHLKHLLRKRMEDAINFLDSDDNDDDTQLQIPDQNSSSEADDQKPRVIEISGPVVAASKIMNQLDTFPQMKWL